MANKLAYYLRRAPAINVDVKYDQVVELIGEEKANELALYKNKTSETRKGRVGPRSLIPAKKRIYSNSLAQFNREQLLEAIDAAKGADFQSSDDDPPPKANPLPNQELLSPEKKRELKARGLVKE